MWNTMVFLFGIRSPITLIITALFLALVIIGVQMLKSRQKKATPGFILYNIKEVFGLRYDDFRSVLILARIYGWVGMGTLEPLGYRKYLKRFRRDIDKWVIGNLNNSKIEGSTTEWAGDYDKDIGAIVTDQDAQSLANALERALVHIPDETYTDSINRLKGVDLNDVKVSEGETKLEAFIKLKWMTKTVNAIIGFHSQFGSRYCDGEFDTQKQKYFASAELQEYPFDVLAKPINIPLNKEEVLRFLDRFHGGNETKRCLKEFIAFCRSGVGFFIF